MTDVPCYPFSRSARSQNIEGAGGKDFRLPLNDDTKPVPDPCRRPEKTFLHCSSVPCIRKADSIRTSMTGGFFSHATVQTRLRRCRRDLPLVILCQNDFLQLIRTSGTIQPGVFFKPSCMLQTVHSSVIVFGAEVALGAVFEDDVGEADRHD